MKYSKQREMILKAVQESNDHPSADEIYKKLKAQCPRLSLGTVYRNLNLLAENGLINKLSLPKGGDRFDGISGSHYHVICESCGGIFDLSPEAVTVMCERVKEETGVTPILRRLVMGGVCDCCADEEKEK